MKKKIDESITHNYQEIIEEKLVNKGKLELNVKKTKVDIIN
jgi:hypothetical protein